jgi:hypothetical protein
LIIAFKRQLKYAGILQKLIDAASADPANPSADNLVSSSFLFSAVNKIAAALSSPANLNALINVSSLKSLVDTVVATASKLVNAVSKVSPGNEDDLWLSSEIASSQVSPETVCVVIKPLIYD